VERHLEVCEQCADRERNLRTFRAMMTTYPIQEFAPSPQPTAWEKFVAFWRPPTRWIPFQVATTAIVAALCVGVFTRPLKQQTFDLTNRTRDLQTQLKQANDENEDLKKQAAIPREYKERVALLEKENHKIQQDYKVANATIGELNKKLAASRQRAPGSSAVAHKSSPSQNLIARYEDVLGLSSLPASHRQKVNTTLVKQKVETPKFLAQLPVRSGGAVQGPEQGDTFLLVSPVAQVILTDKPTFSWTELKGATKYEIVISDEKLNEVGKETVTGTTWTPAKPLPRGKVLTWQVIPSEGNFKFREGESFPTANFFILEQVEVNRLKQAEQTYANSPLTLGVLYAEKGLLEEAQAQFEKLLRINPNSDVAKKLLKDVQDKLKLLKSKK
jgi:tetratricopeptide (TPR) repeat protein